MSAANRYETKLKEAVTTLEEMAKADGGGQDELTADLAKAAAYVKQAYEARLKGCQENTEQLKACLAEVSRTLPVLDRWESLLRLMEHVAREGKITEQQRKELVAHLQNLRASMRLFLRFADAMRKSSLAKATQPTPAGQPKQ